MKYIFLLLFVPAMPSTGRLHRSCVHSLAMQRIRRGLAAENHCIEHAAPVQLIGNLAPYAHSTFKDHDHVKPWI
jgi:hypothetical protein